MRDYHSHSDGDAIKLSALESYGGRPHTLSAYNTLTLKGIGDDYCRKEYGIHEYFLV